MRVAWTALLGLLSLATAEEQVPLADKAKGWFDQAQAFVKENIPNPTQRAAAKVAEHAVTPLTWDNWRSTLRHSGSIKHADTAEAWMVYITGGQKTCRGRCGWPDKSWNESVPYFVSDSSAPRLARLDCEQEGLLCAAWMAGAASIWYIIIPPPPGPAQSPAPTVITIHGLNRTSVTDAHITSIHTRRLYQQITPYEGALHPFDGWVAKLGLLKPLAYVNFVFSKIPSWAFMLGAGSLSRLFASRRGINQTRPRAPAAGAPAAGAKKAQ